MLNILLIDQPHPYLPQALTNLGFTCADYTQASYEEIAAIIHQYDGLVIRSRIPIDRVLLEKATRLQFIARAGAGLESIDLHHARYHNIHCFSSPEGNRDAVAEHALGMLLNLFNHLSRADRQIRAGQWIREGNRGLELKGKTIGIIGYGNMGQAFAQRLQGFGVRVIAYDKYKTNYGDDYAQAVDLPTLCAESDVVSLHIYYSTENHYFFNDALIQQFAKPIYIINTARGLVLNTTDVVKHLETGNILGAALDVLEYEKLSFEQLFTNEMPPTLQYLLHSDQVLLSPHIAGWTVESKRKHAEVLVDKIKDWYETKG